MTIINEIEKCMVVFFVFLEICLVYFSLYSLFFLFCGLLHTFTHLLIYNISHSAFLCVFVYILCFCLKRFVHRYGSSSLSILVSGFLVTKYCRFNIQRTVTRAMLPLLQLSFILSLSLLRSTLYLDFFCFIFPLIPEYNEKSTVML